MIKYEELYEEVKVKLSEKRFKHSEGVVKRAIEYAKVYNVDIETVKLVAISHDIAKELSDEENEKYIKEYNIEIDEVEKRNNNLLHAKIGSYICKNKFGFTQDMANAVKFHTTGRENMTILEKVIYLADATEEGRNYPSDYYVNLSKNNIDRAVFEVCAWTVNRLIERNEVIHLNSIKCYNFYNKNSVKNK